MKVIEINDVLLVVSKNDRVLGKVVDKFDAKRQDPLVVRTFQNNLTCQTVAGILGIK